MKHRESIFAFGANLAIYEDAGDRIRDLKDKIDHRVNGDYAVGNGNFIKLESLKAAQRCALFQILKGVVVIAIGISAVVGAGLLKSCDSDTTANSLPFNAEGLK